MTPVQVVRQSATGDKAVVRAEFKHFGKPVVIDYDLIRNADGWRIYDVRAKGDRSLRQVLKVGQ